MITVSITSRMRMDAEAERERVFAGRASNTDVTGRAEHQIYGFVGEQAVQAYYSALEKSKDWQVDFKLGSLTFDVKSKSCRTPPAANYNGAVLSFQKREWPDYFIFVRVLESLEIAWIAGIEERERFWRTGRLRRAGEINGNFRYAQSEVSLEYAEMIAPEKAKLACEACKKLGRVIVCRPGAGEARCKVRRLIESEAFLPNCIGLV